MIQSCKRCKSESDYEQGSSSRCNFCGAWIGREEEYEIKDYLRFLKEKEGVKAFSDSSRVNALLSDVFSGEADNRMFIRYALDDNVLVNFLKTETENMQILNERMGMVKTAMQRRFSEAATNFICETFSYVMGIECELDKALCVADLAEIETNLQTMSSLDRELFIVDLADNTYSQTELSKSLYNTGNKLHQVVEQAKRGVLFRIKLDNSTYQDMFFEAGEVIYEDSFSREQSYCINPILKLKYHERLGKMAIMNMLDRDYHLSWTIVRAEEKIICSPRKYVYIEEGDVIYVDIPGVELNVLKIEMGESIEEAPKEKNVLKFGGYNWLVLTENEGRALLISEDIVDKKSYNDENGDAVWESSTLRRWLNNVFYNKFSVEEKAKIKPVSVVNSNNQTFGTNGGNDTEDRIFILSIDEARKYFSSDAERKAVHDDVFWWWLRSPGSRSGIAAIVRSDGDISDVGRDVSNDSGGVRPALWIKLTN